MWQPFTDPDDGTIYTFDHLKPIDVVLTITVNKKQYQVPLVLLFSNHCFTDGKDNSVQQNDPWYMLSDSTGHRTFCKERWKSSLTLPDLMHKVVTENAACYRLDRDSCYIHIHGPDQRNRFSGWYIFFEFRRPKPNQLPSLRVTINTHHRRMDPPKSLRWRDSMKFVVILASWLGRRQDYLDQFEIEA